MRSGALATTRSGSERKPYEIQSLDDYITDVALRKTLADLMEMRVSAPSARTAFVASTICQAIFDLDIGLISEIVKRIDGLAPSKGDMGAFSNIFSDALNDVLEYTDGRQLTIYPTDKPIIALAKATVAISVSNPGRNMQARKDRQKAVTMILDRIEGRRSEPAKPVELPEYEEPSWIGLAEGDGDGDQEVPDQGRGEVGR